MDNALKNPLVSVIMPVYNTGSYLQEAIDSILNQTFSDFEFIIIDDASTDDSIKIIESYNDDRITLIKKPLNTGYTKSLNIGLPLSKGKYIARMDSDDIAVNNRLEKQVNYMESNLDTVVCGTNYGIISTDTVSNHPTNPETLLASLMSGCYIAHPTVLIRKSALTENNLTYQAEYEPAEDYNLWVVLSKYGKLTNLPEKLLMYRVHAKQVSTVKNLLQIENADIARLNMARHIVELNDERSCKLHLALVKSEADATFNLQEVDKWAKHLEESNDAKKFFSKTELNTYLNSKRLDYLKTYTKLGKSISILANEAVSARYYKPLPRSMLFSLFIKTAIERIKVRLTALIEPKAEILNNWRNYYFNKAVVKHRANPKSVPILINNFNQLDSLKQLIGWLEDRGFQNIIIIDNRSDYQPLIDWYQTITHEVIYLEENLGHRALWVRQDILSRFYDSYFILTDPDILPSDNCPDDFMGTLINLLCQNPHITKAGFALRIDDIPDYYAHKQKVIRWESTFWNNAIARDIFLADIDTTFALYRPKHNYWSKFYKAIRVAGDFTCRHLGWYWDDKNLTDEQNRYKNTAHSSSSWVARPEWYSGA